MQAVMTEHAGVLRSETGLALAAGELAALLEKPGGEPGTEAWETTNLLTVGAVLAEAARRRRETRGSHWREDFPHRDDEQWTGHVDVRLAAGGRCSPGGGLVVDFRPTSDGSGGER
jgi:L-aspartate oxidase